MKEAPRRDIGTNPLEDPEILLTHLERVDRRNSAWQAYIESRAIEVQSGIDRLTRFGHRSSGVVANIIGAHCRGLQLRLDQVVEDRRR